MATRKKRKTDSPPQPSDAHVFRQLAQCMNKSDLTTALHALHTAGWLTHKVDKLKTGRRVKAAITAAVAEHTNANTPYGTVLQHMTLPLPKLPKWQFAHPLALLYYISQISSEMGDMMAHAATDGSPEEIVIYVDEICPGNPFRPERARTLHAIYWAFIGWPQHVLQRSLCWLTFGTIRATMVDALPGGLPELMRYVLDVFFGTDRHSFQRGCMIFANGARKVIRAQFGGYLADEKALKILNDLKGASGTKCCHVCVNLFNRLSATDPLPAGAFNLSLTDLSLVTQNTNMSFYAMVDALRTEPNDDARAELETMLGVKWNPLGIVASATHRAYYKPIDMYLRDWMHMLLSTGVGNTLVAFVVRTATKTGPKYKLATVQQYFTMFVLPKKHGKLSGAWLARPRFGKKFDALSSFSGYMLSIIPIIAAFTEDMLASFGHLPQLCACMRKFAELVAVLSTGVVDVRRISMLIEEFSGLYVATVRFIDLKPKFHQLQHLADQIRRVGKSLSCFVTERKHRATKRIALNIFRHIEGTVLKGLVNQQCEALKDASGNSLLQRQFLVRPIHEIPSDGLTLRFSKSAIAACGCLCVGDLLYTYDHTVGRAERFWGTNVSDAMLVQLSVLPWDPTAPRTRVLQAATATRFIDIGSIVDAVIYAVATPDYSFRIIRPYSV